jgi:predicted kinase
MGANAGQNRQVDHMMAAFTGGMRGGGPGLEVLVGMVGSGKSTYARRRAARGAAVVCHDDLMRVVKPGVEYDSSLKDTFHLMEEYVIRAALSGGCRVVIDRTNLTWASRSRWTDLADTLSVPCVAIRFPAVDADEHARRRFEDDPQGRDLAYWVNVAENHERQAARAPFRTTEKFTKVVDYVAGAPEFAKDYYDPLA